MKRLVIATLAAGVVLSPFATTTALADHVSPVGFLCDASSTTDGGSDDETYDVTGGPFVLDDGSTPPPGVHSGAVTCTMQVGSSNDRHAGADAAVVAGPTTPAVVAARGIAELTREHGERLYVCTQVTVDGETLYFDDAVDAFQPGSWSTSPFAHCTFIVTPD